MLVVSEGGLQVISSPLRRYPQGYLHRKAPVSEPHQQSEVSETVSTARSPREREEKARAKTRTCLSSIDKCVYSIFRYVSCNGVRHNKKWVSSTIIIVSNIIIVPGLKTHIVNVSLPDFGQATVVCPCTQGRNKGLGRMSGWPSKVSCHHPREDRRVDPRPTG